jgi:tRNA (guanine37-N1)-methyltransferase
MHFHVITLFKDSIESYINESILGRAQGEGKIEVSYYNPRDYAETLENGEKPAYIDGKPYGGGPGMVLQAVPFLKAVAQALKGKKKAKVIFFSPSGKQFTNEYAKKLAKNYKDIVLIAGRYEGIDARVKKALKAEEISIGPYVLTGGEIPAGVVIDSVARQIEGVLGNFDSREEARVSSSEMYTRPEILEYKGKKYSVPKVLLSGDHKKIEDWKKRKA